MIQIATLKKCRWKKENDRQTEMRFPQQAMSHEHEGGAKREKRTILGWLL